MLIEKIFTTRLSHEPRSMHLKHLTLEAFRNYSALELDLGAQVTALVGFNAQGKTNLLESIAFLALGKSFRAAKSIETLQWDRPHGRIQGIVEEEGKEIELEVFFQRSPELKKVKLGSKVVTPKNYLGHLRVVLFTPDQLDLVSGSPSQRRQFLDRLLMQLNAGYVECFGQYQKILEHRNALLKQINLGRTDSWELDLWDARLVEEAEKIWKKRHAFMDFLSARLTKDYQCIAKNKDELEIHYETHQSDFDQRLIAHRDLDLRMGSTSVGPHRDDFALILNKKSLKEMGSRGECRSAVLTLKRAELEYIHETTGEKPLLLLDDVFSELDEHRQASLGDLLQEYQTIITTTSKSHLKDIKDLKIYSVEGGRLTEV